METSKESKWKGRGGVELKNRYQQKKEELPVSPVLAWILRC